MDELEIMVSEGRSGARILQLRGPLTLRTLFEFQDEARKAASAPVLVDLTEVPYMDSAGLGSVLGVLASCQRTGRSFAVAGATNRLKSLFEITHVNQVLPSFATVEEAEQSWERAAGA